MKTTGTKNCRPEASSGAPLRRLIRAPETVNQIYDFAESLYMRDGSSSERMTLADIERVHKFLRQTENNIEEMKKHLRDLAESPGSFHPEEVPIGF